MSREHDMTMDAQDSLLEAIEGAVRDQMQGRRPDQARYGFAARVANATPPVSETFRRTLRVRILAGATGAIGQQSPPAAIVDRTPRRSRWRLSWAGALAALAVLALVLAVSLRLRAPAAGPEARPPAAGAAVQPAPADVAALAQALDGDSAGQAVIVYPAAYAAPLSGQTGRPVVPFEIEQDMTPAAIQAALGALLPASGLVDVVLADQNATDQDRRVRTVLEQRLYRVYRPEGMGAETYGVLERSVFAVGPEEVTLEPIGALFEGGIELVSGSVLDDPRPGEPLRLALDWRIAQPVDDDLVMYVHLVHDGARLVAQRDTAPGNGLFPVKSWEPGQVVRDQFALLLPPELPAGAYELQVGVYSSASGRRYSLVDPEEGTYVIVKQFTLDDPFPGQGNQSAYLVRLV